MTVFQSVFAASVISFSLSAQSQAVTWSYPVDAPIKPVLISTKQLTNPTISQIQNAIQAKTRIDIYGEVDASSGQRIRIDKNDVRLNFKNADQVNWSGSDTWGGFIDVAADRVEVLNLEMKVVGSGRCRGVVLQSPVSDVRIANCTFQNIADGLIADGVWQRLEVKNTSFLDCSDWNSASMTGGYGMFLEEDDSQPDHLKLDNVEITLSASSGQHGLRMSKVQRVWIEDSFISANAKRSMWAYGVDYVTIRDTTFDHGSVLFNLKSTEVQTERATRYVRIDNVTIHHSSILRPLAVFCGKGSRYFLIRDLKVNSTTADKYLEVSWRNGDNNRKINWLDGSITFNGQQMFGFNGTAINDWSQNELSECLIGPVDDPRN